MPRIYADEPVAMDVSDLRHADWPVESVEVAWTDGAGSLPAQPGDPPTLLRHSFPRPGVVAVNVVLRQHRPVGFCSVDAAAVFPAKVHSRAWLAVKAGRPGAGVEAAAETTGRSDGHRPVRQHGPAGRAPPLQGPGQPPGPVHVPLRRRVRGSVRVVLRQGGRTVAKPVVVAL